MKKWLVVLVLAALAFAALPMTVAAFGLDVEAKGGAGIGLGSTSSTTETGSPLLAAGGGVGVDVFLFSAGPVDLGIASGAEYTYLSQHSSDTATTVKEDAQYNYLYIPVSVVGSIPVGPVSLVVHAGGFAGYFLSGKAINITAGGFPQPDTDLASYTEQWEFGIHLAAGVDIPIMSGISVSPAVQFDYGLTDVTVDAKQTIASKDTLASLAFMVSIKYKAM